MPKFIYLYKGPATDMSAMTPEESKAVMDKWNAWYGKQGAAIKDGGSPFMPGQSVLDNGSAGTAADMGGYTIIEAADMNAAKAMTEGHPLLSDNDGKFAIDIYELAEIPGM